MAHGQATALGRPAGAWLLATDRLRLAPLSVADAPDLAAMTDHPAITDVISFLPAPFTQADAEALAARNDGGTDLFLGGRLADESRLLVVVAGLHLRGEAEIELGYWVHPHHHGRGLAREAAGAALAAARRLLPARRPYAECLPANRRSWRVLQSLGFDAAVTTAAPRRPGRRRLDWTPGLHAGSNGRRSGPC